MGVPTAIVRCKGGLRRKSPASAALPSIICGCRRWPSAKCAKRNLGTEPLSRAEPEVRIHLPPAASQHNIIARLPHPEEFIGKNMRGSYEAIMDGGEAGWEEVTGVDGVTRIFGYVPSSLPPRAFFLSIGEAKAEAFAAVNSATWRDGALILAGLVGSICIAWAGRNLVFGIAASRSADSWRPGRAFAGRRG